MTESQEDREARRPDYDVFFAQMQDALRDLSRAKDSAQKVAAADSLTRLIKIMYLIERKTNADNKAISLFRQLRGTLTSAGSRYPDELETLLFESGSAKVGLNDWRDYTLPVASNETSVPTEKPGLLRRLLHHRQREPDYTYSIKTGSSSTHKIDAAHKLCR
ncbi:MAG: hypothetical protein AAF358_02915 [Pseudomonadota bacterium]